MRRRSRAGGEQVKKQHRKAIMLKRRNAPKAARRRSSTAGNETEVARLCDGLVIANAGAGGSRLLLCKLTLEPHFADRKSLL